MDEYKQPSQWCKEKQEEALGRGDVEEAMNYFKLAEEWKGRGY